MSALPKIPSPKAYYWDEFRRSYLPVIVFVLVLGCSINLWMGHVAPPVIVGEVEIVRSSITATAPGEILDLKVDLLQRVAKDDPIAVVSVMEDDTVQATIRSEEADLVILEERLRQSNVRILEDYESLKHGLAMRRVERAAENVNLQHAITEFQRSEKLLKERTVSESEHDLAKTTRDSLQEKVAQLDTLISEMEASLVKLKPPDDASGAASETDPIVRAIKGKQDAIRMASKPQVIKAPIAGMISAIYKRKGEKVVRGDAIVLVSSTESERIVGFVRQPLNIKPKVGDSVEVRSRSSGRASAMAKVLQVGTQLEMINPALLPVALQDGVSEYGLPMLIGLPKGLQLMPGETVDIRMAAGR
ncbi:MAG TPA: hypothetical protein PLU30_02325 [Verrucomicrobiae bacterium]|nr:hypothetical protein [Verrucomicrobiae bacterium]